MNHDDVKVLFEDVRYPIIHITDENDVSHCYAVNLRNGSLRPVCCCNAYEPGECCCGTGNWEKSDYDYDYDD